MSPCHLCDGEGDITAAKLDRLREAIRLHRWARRGEGDAVDVELWEDAGLFAAADPNRTELSDQPTRKDR